MKTHLLNNNNWVTIFFVMLFIVIPCSFETYACKATCAQSIKLKDTGKQTDKKILLPAVSPLQVISSKFL